MSDLIERLRRCPCDFHKDERLEAADELERLQKIIDRVALIRLDLESENIKLKKIAEAAIEMRHDYEEYKYNRETGKYDDPCHDVEILQRMDEALAARDD